MTGVEVIGLCREIALCTEEPGKITRTFRSAPMADVRRILGDRMCDLGMRVRVDAAENLRGIYGDPDAPRLIIGSHLDTVPDAGAFDGVLGVVMGIAMVESRPKMAIEIIGFSEEEIAFLGSRSAIGTLGPAVAYLEFHIEQGPVLDRADLAIGIVDAIVGQSRLAVTFTGQANHAGTTPMDMRRDALVAAAEWIVRVESFARSVPGLVATVGSLHVSPNAGNVIPGSVRASLDVRHESDAVRHDTVQQLLPPGASYEVLMDQAAVPLDAHLRDLLGSGFHMTSGAGHDAMILAPHVPSAMLFLRSPGGISHHPDEAVYASDIDAAIEAGRRFIAELEREYA